MIEISSYLSFLPSSKEPLSANVFFIEGDNNTYIFDVGRNDEAYKQIESITKNKVVIISHFHGDHLENINRISFNDLLVGNYTYTHTNKGNIVKDKVFINDGVRLEVLATSSVHSKGSLVVNINNEYCLIGDLVYSKPPLNRSLYIQMLKELEKIDTKYFVIGHGEDCVHEAKGYITSLKKVI